MLVKLLSNTTTSIITAIINFVLVIIVSNYLGRAAVAEMGLIIFGVTAIVMFSNIIGGGALVYLLSKYPLHKLLPWAYVWSIISSILMGIIFYLFKIVPREFLWLSILIGFFESGFLIHQQILINKRKIIAYSFLRLMYRVMSLILFLTLGISLDNFVLALQFSVILIFIISMLKIVGYLEVRNIIFDFNIFKKMFSYGVLVQGSNVFQIFNYRWVYFVIDKNLGKDMLGLFTIATNLAESILIPSRSLATIQYGEIVNKEKDNEKVGITLSFFKLNFVITIILIGALLLFPDYWFSYIFGKNFTGISPIIDYLVIGIFALAIKQITTHYFSGIGIYHIGFVASIIGFVVIMMFSYYLVMKYGLIGGAIATSLSYLASSTYTFVRFNLKIKRPIKDYFLDRGDIKLYMKKFK